MVQISRPVSATVQAQHTAAVVNQLSAVLQAVLQVRHSICDIHTVAHLGHSALHIPWSKYNLPHQQDALREILAVPELRLQCILQDHQVNKQRIAQGSSPANVVLLRGCGSRWAVFFQELWVILLGHCLCVLLHIMP